MTWDTVQKVEDARALVPKLDVTATTALKYLTGDYWQGGKGWVGTQVPADAQNRAIIEDELKRTFTPQPLIEDCIGRLVDALTAQEPAWEFVLTRTLAEGQEYSPEEQKLRDETNAEMGEWWDTREAHELVQEFTGQLLGTGRAALRFWVPRGLLRDGNNGKEIIAKDWKEALKKIYLEIPAPESAAVALDRDTMQPVSVFLYSAKDENDQDTQYAEISWLNEAGKTVVRILKGDLVDDEVEQSCGGELYVDEVLMPALVANGGTQLPGRSLVTEAVQRMQNALNVVNTMLLHNSNLAGFRERNYINLQIPKRKVEDPTSATGYKLEDDTVQVGPSAANFLTGVTYTDSQGNKNIANGAIVITDPVDPKPLIEAKREFEYGLLKAFKQLHTAMNSDATASAISRVVAMVEFLQLCRKIRPKLEGILRSRLRGIAFLSAYLANDTARLAALETLRLNVNVRITPPPLSPDERRVVVELFKAGLISRELAMTLLAVEDVDAEVKKIEEDPMLLLEIRKKMSEIVEVLTRGGAGIEEAALVAGFEKAEAKQLGRGDFVAPDDNSGGNGSGTGQ